MAKPLNKKCNQCGVDIILIPDDKNHYKPISVESYDGEEIYDRKKHQIHFRTCSGQRVTEDSKAQGAGY
jgi:hypothetical protein